MNHTRKVKGSVLNNFFLLFLLFLFVGCSATDNMILDYKDVQFFRSELIREGGSEFLVISGLAFHSSLAISEIHEQRDGNSKVILIDLAVAKKGESGSFKYRTKIEPAINSIRFGQGNHEIWKRTE